MASRAGIAVICVLLAVGAAVILWSGEDRAAYVEAGVAAPGFTLPGWVGGSPRDAISLDAYRGQVVLVNFWATWCKPCEDEMPSMQRRARALEGERFALLAVSVDETADPIAGFLERYALTFPVLHDPEKRVAGAYQAYRFPESFLIDAQGQVIQRYIGPRDWDAPEYARRIRELAAVLP